MELVTIQQKKNNNFDVAFHWSISCNHLQCCRDLCVSSQSVWPSQQQIINIAMARATVTKMDKKLVLAFSCPIIHIIHTGSPQNKSYIQNLSVLVWNMRENKQKNTPTYFAHKDNTSSPPSQEKRWRGGGERKEVL